MTVRKRIFLGAAVAGLALMTVPWWPGCRLSSTIVDIWLAGFWLIPGAGAALLLDRRQREDHPLVRICAAIGIAVLTFGAWSFFSANMGAINRGQQKRTIGDLRTIATMIEQYAASHGRYPVAASGDELWAALGPAIPRDSWKIPTDSWKHEWMIRSTATSYTIASYGCCGEPDVADPSLYAPAGTTNYKDDIVFSNGAFLRYPDGTQR